MPRIQLRRKPYSLLPNGTSQYGVVTSPAFANNTKLTILCWVKLQPSPSANRVIYEAGAVYVTNSGFALVQNGLATAADSTSLFAAHCQGAAVAVSAGYTKNLPAGTWLRVCHTIDESLTSEQNAVYVNGVFEALTRTANGNCTGGIATQNLNVMARNAGSSAFFNGNVIIDQVIVGKAFTADEARTEYQTWTTPTGGTTLLSYAWNEGTGNTIADSSGNGKNIALTGSPTWSTDAPLPPRVTVRQVPYSLQFNGTNQYGQITAAPFANATQVTVLGWLRLASVAPVSHIVFEAGVGFGGDKVMVISCPGNKMCVGASSTSGGLRLSLVQTNDQLVVGRWYRFCGVLDETLSSNQTTLYLNGVNPGVSYPNNDQVVGGIATADTFIGIRNTSFFPLDGNVVIDHVITGKAFTEAEALSEYATGRIPSGGTPLLTYAWDEGTGASIVDSSGNAKNIALTNSPVWSFDSPVKRRLLGRNIPFSIVFDGAASIISSAATTGISGDTAVSLECWIKASAFIGSPISIGGGASAFDSMGIYLGNGSGVLSVEFDGNKGWRSAAGVIQLERWYHVVATKRAGAYETTTVLYVNGQLVACTANSSGSPNITNSKLFVGRYSSGLFFAGEIAQPRLWNVELTAAQVQALYLYGVKPSTPLIEYLETEGFGTTVADTGSLGATGTITSGTWTTDSPMK